MQKETQNKPLAYLVSEQDHFKRYPILSDPWRIGRKRDNELTLRDPSVSRYHAKIQRDNDGNFFIVDMASLDGTYVNDEQVSLKKLQEGDIIKICKMSFRFTQHSED